MASMLMLCIRLQLLQQCMARHLANRLENMIVLPIKNMPKFYRNPCLKTTCVGSKHGLIIWIGDMD